MLCLSWANSRSLLSRRLPVGRGDLKAAASGCSDSGIAIVAGLLFLFSAILAYGQPRNSPTRVTVTVADENGKAVADAAVTISEPGLEAAHLWTDFAGNCTHALRQQKPYQIHAEKPGFYKADESESSKQSSVRVTLAHQQIVREQVNVTASTPGIDTEQVSDQMTLNTPEIVNIPYATSNDIRCLLPFNPGVVPDGTRTGARGRIGDVGDAGHAGWVRYSLADGRLAEPPRQHRCSALHRPREHALSG